MTISDANWNSATDPYVEGDPVFATTPSPVYSVATNLIRLTWTGKGFLSNVVHDENRQTVVLRRNTDDSIEFADQFHSHGDRTNIGTDEFRAFDDRFTGSDGTQRRVEMFAPTIVMSDAYGNVTWQLTIDINSFPTNEYQVVVIRYPAYFDKTVPQLITALGMHYAQLAIWDDQGLGNFSHPRDFMDKASFQALATRIEAPNCRFVASKGKAIDDHIMALVSQAPDLYSIRPNDTLGDGMVSLHALHRTKLAKRTDLVLDSATLATSKHVLDWECRLSVVEPVTGYKVTYGYYAQRENNNTSAPSSLLKNSFPLDYKTMDDRFDSVYSSENVIERPHPNACAKAVAVTLDLGGIQARNPLYQRLLSQDEVVVEFDWYGMNFMPGDHVQIFLDEVGFDETTGATFVVEDTAIKDALKGIISVTFRRAYGIENPHPYEMRGEAAGDSSPAEHWPFMYSAENLGAMSDGDDPFALAVAERLRYWRNDWASTQVQGDYAAGGFDEHMRPLADTSNATYHDIDDANAPYFRWPSVRFNDGTQQSVRTVASGGDALMWWVWKAIDLSEVAKYLLHHVKDASNHISALTAGTAGKFLIQARVAGVTHSSVVDVSESNSTYIICRFESGGTNRVNVSGTLWVPPWGSFPGMNSANPFYFGTDGGSNTGVNANVAEMGLLIPQGAESIGTMYTQLEAYIKEKYNA